MSVHAVNRLDYAPKRVLTYMAAGWLLRSNEDGHYALLSPSRDKIVDVNPRTFRALWQSGKIQIDMTWNHPKVTHYLLCKEYRPHD